MAVMAVRWEEESDVAWYARCFDAEPPAPPAPVLGRPIEVVDDWGWMHHTTRSPASDVRYPWGELSERASWTPTMTILLELNDAAYEDMEVISAVNLIVWLANHTTTRQVTRRVFRTEPRQVGSLSRFRKLQEAR
jgi:hypothetical protein